MSFSEEWIDILKEVSTFRQDNGNHAWFRGMCDATFKLNSGLFRDYNDLKSLINDEATLYHLFKNMGHLEHNKEEWELLYVMQHHGVKTRLLDWSESFSVALFFAYSTWDQKSDAVVWALQPAKLNYLTSKFRGLRSPKASNLYLDYIKKKDGNKSTVAIFPEKNSKRIIAQQGVFTLQGNSMLPLEEEHSGKLLSENILKKILIPKELAHDVKLYLELSGMNYYTLFPDLDGLARHLTNEFKFGKPNSNLTIPDLPEPS